MRYYKDNDRPIQPHDICRLHMGLIPSDMNWAHLMIQLPCDEPSLSPIPATATCTYPFTPADVDQLKLRAFFLGKNFLIINQDKAGLILFKWK